MIYGENAEVHILKMLIIHAVSENGKLELEEKQVARLAHGLYAIIRDNKLNFNE